jgi:glycine oxidase
VSRSRVVVVVGGGIIGLSCADELLRAGHEVLVCDPAPASGATHAAAGMLAPAGEAWFGEDALFRLGLDSLDRWPAFAASLEQRSGIGLDLRNTGTLLVGMDRDDVADVRRSCALLEESGVRVESLDRGELRRREPRVSSRATGGAWLPGDRHVDPRQVAVALLALLGDRVVPQRATPVAGGVALADGRTLPADVVVLATGATGLASVRPVRGEVVRVRTADAPAHALRARVHGQQVYAVPRTSGEVVIGATEEEHPGHAAPTLGGVARLLDAARQLLPGLDTAELVDVVARDRPGTPDNGPLLGVLTGPGPETRIVAGGHYRSGVLLAPLTAAVVRALVEESPPPDVALPFRPDRFERTTPCS